MTHEELIEQVARAIAKEHARMGAHYGSMAKAAIYTIRAAISEPNEAMQAAFRDVDRFWPSPLALTAAIEASALGEQSE